MAHQMAEEVGHQLGKAGHDSFVLVDHFPTRWVRENDEEGEKK